MVTKKHYYKSVRDGYVDHVGFGYGFPELDEEEYQAAREKLLNAPEVEEGQEVRLREDLTWEIVNTTIEQEVSGNEPDGGAG